MQIVFPCPNCGASQSVDDSATSTQCQFCGNTIPVPEEMRAKTPPPSSNPAMPQAISLAGLTGFPGLSGMPLNMDISKLRDLGHAVRAGDKAQATQLYEEIFGIRQAEAQQIVDTMMTHHGVVSSQIQMGAPPMIQMQSMTPPALATPSTPYNMPSYVTPSMPMMVTGQRGRGRGAACFTTALFLCIGIVAAGAILAAVLFSTPGTLSSITSLFSRATNQYPRVVMTFGGRGSGQGQFDDPRSIAVDGSGKIYVADYGDGRLQVFDPQGKFVSQFTIQDEKQPYIMGLAAGQSGTLYAVVSGNLYTYDAATGKSLGQLKADTGSDSDVFDYNDVAIRPGGGLVAASYSGDDNLVLFKSNRQYERVITDAISTISGDPELDMRVAVDGNDNVYVLGTFNNAVFHYNAQGQYVNHFGSEGGQNGQFQSPSDIAVDGQGRVYVSDDKGIQVFSPDGRFLSVIGMPDLAYVFGLTFDEQGALYAISNTRKVYKILVSPPQ